MVIVKWTVSFRACQSHR